MYLEIFLADFAVFRVFGGISRDFAGPPPREISEALHCVISDGLLKKRILYNFIR